MGIRRGRKRDDSVGIRRGGSENRGDKIHSRSLVHLVRSRGGAAFEQPIAAQSFGYFVIGVRSAQSIISVGKHKFWSA